MDYNKVKICGMSTDSLRVLSEKEKQVLFKKMKNGTAKEKKEAKDKLVNGNLKLALSVTQKFINRRENIEDLFQIACIGLVKSVDNFNPEIGVRFSTYAVPMMIGEIKRYLRDNSSIRVSRSLKDLAHKAVREKEKLTEIYKREPTVSEIAKALEVSTSALAIALDSINIPISIYETATNTQESLYLIDQIGDKNNEKNWLKEISIKESIKSLSDKQKSILSLRFFEGKTQIEVAEQIGVSQAQISRLEKNALNKIKKQI